MKNIDSTISAIRPIARAYNTVLENNSSVAEFISGMGIFTKALAGCFVITFIVYALYNKGIEYFDSKGEKKILENTLGYFIKAGVLFLLATCFYGPLFDLLDAGLMKVTDSIAWNGENAYIWMKEIVINMTTNMALKTVGNIIDDGAKSTVAKAFSLGFSETMSAAFKALTPSDYTLWCLFATAILSMFNYFFLALLYFQKVFSLMILKILAPFQIALTCIPKELGYGNKSIVNLLKSLFVIHFSFIFCVIGCLVVDECFFYLKDLGKVFDAAITGFSKESFTQEASKTGALISQVQQLTSYVTKFDSYFSLGLMIMSIATKTKIAIVIEKQTNQIFQ